MNKTSAENYFMAANKIRDAQDIITRCIGIKGVWASTSRYAQQCWTRDFCLATSYLLMHNPHLQSWDVVSRHLYNLAMRQNSNGKIPILYLDDDIAFLRSKIHQSIATGKIPFMLSRYLDREIENLTPHTRDSELFYIITATEFLQLATRKNYYMDELTKNTISSARFLAMDYIEKNLLVDNLVPGADWRDTRDDLDKQCVLTNACLLYKAYTCLSMHKHATIVKNIIQEKYWTGQYFRDYMGTENFDILGNSLAVLYGLATAQQCDTIFQYTCDNLLTPYGFKMTDTFLPALNEHEKQIMKRDAAVIWPFINGFMLDAMLQHGTSKWQSFAKTQFSVWTKLPGFYEWYDICDGIGYGSENQTWSAALYLRVASRIQEMKI